MKIIVITGPSGSGKTVLSKKLLKVLNNSVLIKTDYYYKDNIFIKLLSLFKYDIYDRIISIKSKEIIKTIESLYNKENSILYYNYDFIRRKSSRSYKQINQQDGYDYLILEGIFAHRLNINYKQAINILCMENKEICYQRRLKRDQLERGRTVNEIDSKINKSWDLFFSNLINYISNNKFISINPSNNNSLKMLIKLLKD